MRTESFAALDAVPERYRRLAGRSPDCSFDQTLDWFATLSSSIMGELDELRILGVSSDDGSEGLALLPLYLQTSRTGPFVTRSIHSLANYYTAHFGPIVSSDAGADDVAGSLCEALETMRPRWHVLDLNPVDASTPVCRALADAFRTRGYSVQSYFRFGNWYLDVAGRSFEEYFQGLPSRMRNTLKRKEKKLHREKDVELEIHTSEDNLEEALAAYRHIYTLSWKVPEPYPEFIENIARRFASFGWLRLGLVRIDGTPAAAQIWFVKDGVASIFKLAYDPDFGSYSVGSILTRHLMQYAIDEDRVSIVDYLCGDDKYKQDWMSDRRERSGLSVFRRSTPAGLIGALRASVGKLIR